MKPRLLFDLYTLAALSWLVVWRLLGDQNGWLAMANAWVRWILGVLIPVGAVSLGTRWRAGAAVWFLGAGLLIRRRARFTVDRSAGAATDAGADNRSFSLRLLSANLRNESRSLDAAARLLLAQDAAIMLFMEATVAHREQLDEVLSAYPHRCWVPYPPTNMGLGAVSRHPFAVTGFWQKPGLEPFALRLTLALPTGALDVYCVHTMAPTHQIRRLGPTALLRVRERQILTILSEVERRTNPAVLAGDWNQTEGADSYRWLTRRLVDGWRQAGRGIGFTWPRVHGAGQGTPLPPLLRLDYLFHTGTTRSPHMVAECMTRILESIGSDHCPIVADLSLIPAKRNGRESP